MSAITGIFYRNGRNVKPELIKKMNNKLSHHGPDGSAVLIDRMVALGHQMLFTTQESLHEVLPFKDDKSGLMITADARIDNRNELSMELGIDNKIDIPDSYFILKSYEKWGEKCPEHLLGDFAFAIWDTNEEKLFCARDHIGVKPFYYYIDDNIFVFGTEIKALFKIPDIPYILNEKKVAYNLIRVYTDKKLTFYKNIFSLSAAHSFHVGRASIDEQKYWELDPESQIIMDSEEDYIIAFRKIFYKAVNCRMRSAFPIGFELSGGLDSSSVVCMAKNILNNDNSTNNDLNTYSMVFDDIPQADESYYIKKVVDSGGINPHFIQSDNISPLKNIDSALFQQDQPFITTNMGILCNMYEKAQKDNIRIIIGGEGGDEVISLGTNYLLDLALSLKWIKLINEIYNTSKRSKHNFFSLFFILIIIPLLPDTIKRFLVKIFYFNKKMEKDNNILNKKFSDKMGGEDFLNSCRFESTINKAKTARMHHYVMLNKFSHQNSLEMLDRITSNYSIESRHPFLDKRMIEFCYSIPNDMKFKLGWSRYILRISMQDILPKEIEWRPHKKHFGSVLEKNLLGYEKIKLDEIFSTDNSILKQYVNLDVIKNIYQDYESRFENKNYNSWNSSMFDLWNVIILDLWLNLFFKD